MPLRLDAAAALLLTVIACAPMRPSPGDLAPMPVRVTNEILAADLATIDAWELRRESLLRNDGADLATRTVVLARAGVWLVFAREIYTTQPRAHEADDALAEARRLIESLSDVTRVASSATSSATSSALLASAKRLDPEAWKRLRELKGSSEDVTLAGGIRLAPPDALRANARTVHFALASDVLHGPSAALLDGVADVMRQHPDVSLVIEGHADPRGADTSNLQLSGRRAEGVRQWLVASGVDGDRVLVRMFGARQRNGAGTTVLDYARDRRVQLRFVLPDGAELPASRDESDLQIEPERLWIGAQRPGLRRYVPEPGSTVVPPPVPVALTNAKRTTRARTNTTSATNSTQTTPRGKS
jgi:outer membrane protein OmpA-like peptidoglycan-associated protein